ncbi:hypothetical protein AB0J38_22010 [Streptomyces sp. NPDC050095]|uniref:hypothetical protein n=1 Tax=unclassified Streptomyces TaxID=2593676 RepID=UPI003416CA1C
MSVQQGLSARPLPVGSVSLTLGALSLALFASPWLPAALPPAVRYFPLYLTIPAGICAIVAGINSLRQVSGHEGVLRWRARAGIALGTLAIIVPLAVVAIGCIMLSHEYARGY